jgi:hypothetical protein
MKTKTTKAITPVVKTLRTPDEVFAYLERAIERSIESDRKSIEEGIASQREAYNKASCAFLDVADDGQQWLASRTITLAYSSLQAMHETNGEFQVWLAFRNTVKKFRNEGSEGLDLFRRIAASNANAAIDDEYRHENSSSQFSNATTNATAQGRGRAYRRIRDLLENCKAEAAEWVESQAEVELVGAQRPDSCPKCRKWNCCGDC